MLLIFGRSQSEHYFPLGYHKASKCQTRLFQVVSQVASSLGIVNMRLRNSVIIRVCMGINRLYGMVQNNGEK